jgi:opacity protein-like surface antigen
MKSIIVAAVLLAFSLTTASAADRVPPLLWGQWLIGFDAEGWSGNCKDGHGYEVLTVEPRRMFVNEFGCTITSVTVITKRAAPIANAGLDLQVSLTCSGEGRRGSQNLRQTWSVFEMGKVTFLAIADRTSVALLRKCDGVQLGSP